MGSSARTTPRIRAELKASKEGGRALAARYGLNAKTVRKINGDFGNLRPQNPSIEFSLTVLATAIAIHVRP